MSAFGGVSGDSLAGRLRSTHFFCLAAALQRLAAALPDDSWSCCRTVCLSFHFFRPTQKIPSKLAGAIRLVATPRPVTYDVDRHAAPAA